jgi:hypothetical protein
MVPAEWRDPDTQADVYPEPTWASEWHRIFQERNPGPEDKRDELTWRDRFNNLYERYSGRAKLIDRWWNFYSEGEDVLNNATLGTDFADSLNTKGEYGWAVQEKNKGLGDEKGLPFIDFMICQIFMPGSGVVADYFASKLAEDLCGVHGGWLFNTSKAYWSAESIISDRPNPTLVAQKWTQQQLNIFRAHPVFDKGPPELAFLYDPDPSSDAYRVPDDFFNMAGYNGYNANKILADMIPARTFAAGSNEVMKMNSGQDVRNINMNSMKDNGWTEDDAPHYRWRHSDLKKVSYYYTFKVYNQIVGRGELDK